MLVLTNCNNVPIWLVKGFFLVVLLRIFLCSLVCKLLSVSLNCCLFAVVAYIYCLQLLLLLLLTNKKSVILSGVLRAENYFAC